MVSQKLIFGGLAAAGTNEIQSIGDSVKGKKLISSLKGESLTKKWEEEFESDSENIKALLKNSSLVKSTGGVELSKWCSRQMHLDASKNQEILRNVEKYCLIRSISDQLSRKGKRLLKEGDDGWSSIYSKRKERSTTRGDVGLSGDWSNVQESNDLQIIKNWCSVNSVLDFIDSGEDSVYIKVLKWCTLDGASVN